MRKRLPAHIRSDKGLSIGEVLLVILLISILAIIIVPRFLGMTRTAKWEACATNVANLNALVQLYFIKEETWPALDLADIKTNTSYFPDATMPTCPVTSSAAYVTVSPGHYVTGHLRTTNTHP